MKSIRRPLLRAAQLAAFAFPATALAQTPLPGSFTSLTTTDNILSTGTFGTSPVITTAGVGTRMMWYPRKAAFRAGGINGTQWNDAFIGNYSAAFGNSTRATGANSTAFGVNSIATGTNSTAFGANSTASAGQATAFGNGVTASGDSSTALGIGTRAAAMGVTSLGRFNTGAGSATTWVETDALFEIGNGSSNTARKNALTVLKNGNTSISGSLSTGGALIAPSISTTGAIQAGSISTTNLSASTITSNGQEVITPTSLGAALNATFPPTSTAWSNAYVPRNSTANGSLALGSAQATGAGSFASGAARATGGYSSAHGLTTTASGHYSLVSGFNSTASGTYSVSLGYGTRAAGNASTSLGIASNANGDISFTQGLKVYANSLNEVVLGRGARQGVSRPDFWHDHDALFRIGNGDVFADYSYHIEASDAITVLKSGHTTLGNKYWRRSVAQDATAALKNPASVTDHGGEALVVDGHARLRGKVIIEQAQGDISMGIYGGDSLETPDNVIHGVITLTSSQGHGSGSIQIDGRTISAIGIQWQNGWFDNGWFEENGNGIPLDQGEAVLSDGKKIVITGVGVSGIGIAILPAQ